MADVFISYAREDKARAEQVAKGLEGAGLDVFWDSEIPPGQTWADYIEDKLSKCKAVIVLWSENSTRSQWVREEARMGRDRGTLIPAMIDASQAPFGFGEVQAANLATWNGANDHVEWRRFVEAVRSATGSTAAPAAIRPAMSAPPAASGWTPPAATPAKEKKGGVPVWVWVVGAVVATIVVLGIIGSMLPPDNPAAPGEVAQNTPPAGAQPVAQQPQLTVQQYEEQVALRLSQVEQAFATQGFQRINAPVNGTLPQGQTQQFPVTLEVGGDYRIIGVCDNDCADLDLVLYDQNNNIVSQDQSTDAVPVVSVAPQWTGPFTVHAHMYNCAVSPCYYALVLYARPLQ